MLSLIQPTIYCKCANEFLSVLSPLSPLFQDKRNSGYWLFRGQSRDYPLIPSLFRKNENLNSLTQRDIGNHSQLLLAERDILIQFFNIADKRGLVLPDDSQELRLTFETLRSERGDRFIEDSEWHIVNQAPSLTALAQHYGVPTRLLDWSRQPYVAAFFAAESMPKDAQDWASENDEAGYVVVWAFYFPVLGKHDVIRQLNDPVRIITAPTATNPNLKAQQGVFTFINPSLTNRTEEYPALDKFLEGLAANADPESSASDQLIVNCKIQKIFLPRLEARELLHLLAKWDITPSSIYPGYHSVVADMRMHKD